MQKNGTIDKNIKGYNPLMSPKQLITDLPRTDVMTETTEYGRQAIRNILDGTDSRKFVIVGGPVLFTMQMPLTSMQPA